MHQADLQPMKTAAIRGSEAKDVEGTSPKPHWKAAFKHTHNLHDSAALTT